MPTIFCGTFSTERHIPTGCKNTTLRDAKTPPYGMHLPYASPRPPKFATKDLRTLLHTLLEFADHCREAGLLSSGGVSVYDPLGTRLIQCLDRLAKQLFGIFHTPGTNRLDDVLATVTNERPPGAVAFAGGDVLAKPFFGTGNVWHKFLRNLPTVSGKFYPIFCKRQGRLYLFPRDYCTMLSGYFFSPFYLRRLLCYEKPLFHSFAA